MTHTVHELLQESVALIPADGGDMVIQEFYRRLMHAAPGLAPLFPRDLLTAAHGDTVSAGALQRDKLLNAIVALADNYGGTPEQVTRLREALIRFGRAHAAFQRPDGTVEGATPEEYLAVKDVFLGTLIDLTGEAWTVAYSTAWSRAYNYAMSVMLGAQAEHLEQHPDPFGRLPRADAGQHP